MVLDRLVGRRRWPLSWAPRDQGAFRAQIMSAVMMAAVGGVLTPAPAQDYPSQTIKVISSVSAGGTLDIFARAFAEELHK